jgi:preprotein translocase subunit YajC
MLKIEKMGVMKKASKAFPSLKVFGAAIATAQFLMMTEFVYSADAAVESSTSFQSIATGLMPLLLVVVVFYFLILRPQQKKSKEHGELLASLKRGDNVVLNSGIHGTVSRVEDLVVGLEIAPGVIVKAQKDSILAVKQSKNSNVSVAENKNSNKKINNK